MAKKLKDQIVDLENTRAAKVARMEEIMQKSADEGRATDEAEREEYDTLATEVKTADGDLKRLRDLVELNKSTAEPVEGKSSTAGSESRAPGNFKVKEKLEPGIEFARFAMCVGAAQGNAHSASTLAQRRFPTSERLNRVLKALSEAGTVNVQKAAVAGGTTTDSTWAGPLLEYNQFAGDFIEFLRPRTIVGQFGSGSIPGLRNVPFNVHIRGQTSGGTGYWVGQGKPKPLTKFDFNDTYMPFTKVAAISVMTEELLRFSNPSAERLVRDALAGALIERVDTDFIDPSFAGSANVSPASITNGATTIASTGTDAAAVRADIAALWEEADDADLPTSSAVYITDSRTARRLSLMRNELGQPEFPGVTMMGGNLDGIPLIVSNYVPHDTSGSLFVLAFASEIWLADDGMVTIDASREASLEMDDAPTNNADVPSETTLVSMYQTDSVALRAHRFINWKKRRSQAVAYLTGVLWGSEGS